MDGISAQNNSMPIISCGVLGLQRSMHVNHQQNSHPYQGLTVHPQKVQNVSPFRVGNMQQSTDQFPSLFDGNSKGTTVMDFTSQDECTNIVGEGVNGLTEDGKEKNGLTGGGREKNKPMWQPVRWTDLMVKLLITALSYVEDNPAVDCNSSGGSKKGKWKAISKVMVERGCRVSPQQCEDKFNGINKKYKRLHVILGEGSSCRIVENPGLLGSMDLCVDAKDEVWRILCSKQFFYREMCSYHNGNRLFLPHDQDLQQSVRLALSRKDGYERDGEMSGFSAKRKKRAEENENVGLCNLSSSLGCGKISVSHPPTAHISANLVSAEDGERERKLMMSRSLQLEEQKFQIQEQMFKVEMHQLKWLRFKQKKGSELDQVRLENKHMELENERLASELRRREMCAGSL